MGMVVQIIPVKATISVDLRDENYDQLISQEVALLVAGQGADVFYLSALSVFTGVFCICKFTCVNLLGLCMCKV